MQALKSTQTMMDSLPSNFAAEQPELFERARATFTLLEERLTDPAVAAISDASLSNAHNWIQQCQMELQNAASQGNPQQLVANNQFASNLDALAQNWGQFPVSQPSEIVSSLAEEARRRLEEIQQIQIDLRGIGRSLRDQQQQIISEAQEAKQEGMTRLQEQEAAAGKLLAALGAQGTSSGYAGTASAEKTQADFWRWTTLASGGITAILAVVLFLSIHEQGIPAIITRAGVTIPAILLTVYAGKQSSGHRTQEREAKRLELAFGSVDAYLADLESAKRAELKTLVSANLFGRGQSGPGSVGEDYPSSADLVGLLNEAIKRLR